LSFLELSLGEVAGEKDADAADSLPVDTEVLYFLAICCYEVGRDDAALEYTLRTLAMGPEHEGALALRMLLNG